MPHLLHNFLNENLFCNTSYHNINKAKYHNVKNFRGEESNKKSKGLLMFSDGRGMKDSRCIMFLVSIVALFKSKELFGIAFVWIYDIWQ
ncbi:Protein of unknown function, partial [Gryllus bimaculatus]